MHNQSQHTLCLELKLGISLTCRAGGSSGGGVSASQFNKANKKVEELQTKLVAKTEELMEAQKTWMEVKESLRSAEDETKRKEKL